jgi:hypothetical protein
MDMYRRLALLPDRDAKLVLNRIIGGLVPAEPLLERPGDLKSVISEVAEQTQVSIKPDIDDAVENQSAAIRLLLTELADGTETQNRLTAALDMDREVLVEPVTTALIMAGIVVLLQTHIKIRVKKVNGKTSVEFDLEKKPTADAIIKKFFGFFAN